MDKNSQWIVFLALSAIAFVIVGVLQNNFITMIAGVATILLTILLLLGMNDGMKKSNEQKVNKVNE